MPIPSANRNLLRSNRRGVFTTVGGLVMGTWGFRTFESDEALEWAEAFALADDPIATLENTLSINVEDISELDGLHILCAAEALIAVLARPRQGSPVYFDDPSSFEADAVRLKPTCLMLLRYVLADSGGYRGLWFDKNGVANPEWEAEVRSLIDDLENA